MSISESENRNLVLYFLITFTWSWSFWIPLNLFSIDVFLYIGTFGPFVGAFSLTYLNEGKEGVKKLLKRGWDYKIRKKWFLVIFLFWPVLFGSAFLLIIFIEGETPTLSYLSQPWIILSSFFLYLGGSFAEEFGWRGFAIDRLQVKWNALVSSIILGVIWGFWHLPINIVLGIPWFMVIYVPLVILYSILFTWIYNNSDGSILGAILFHTMLNLIAFPTGEYFVEYFYYQGIVLIVTMVVIAIFGFKKLTISKNDLVKD